MSRRAIKNYDDLVLFAIDYIEEYNVGITVIVKKDEDAETHRIYMNTPYRFDDERERFFDFEVNAEMLIESLHLHYKDRTDMQIIREDDCSFKVCNFKHVNNISILKRDLRNERDMIHIFGYHNPSDSILVHIFMDPYLYDITNFLNYLHENFGVENSVQSLCTLISFDPDKSIDYVRQIK